MKDTWELPNPFISDKGEIHTKREWEQQRENYKMFLEREYYGQMPPKPEKIESEIIQSEKNEELNIFHETVRLKMGPEEKVQYNVHIYRQGGAEKAIPMVLPNGDRLDKSVIINAVQQGFCIASLEIDEAAPDDKEKYNKGGCGIAYPHYSWRALAMWAWLESRVIDWLEGQSFVDMDKVVVSGHSRMGKTAVCCGIFDERVAVVAAAGSGCGGMGSLRLNGGRLGEGVGRAERIGIMLRPDNFGYWLLDSVAAYGTSDGRERYRENEFPIDANILGSCIAPRGLVLLEGLDDIWVNPFGTQAAWFATCEIYNFLGETEKCAIHYREGGHEFNKEDWRVMLDFCKVILEGEEKMSNYKTYGSKEFISGYTWRAPSRKDKDC